MLSIIKYSSRCNHTLSNDLGQMLVLKRRKFPDVIRTDRQKIDYYQGRSQDFTKGGGGNFSKLSALQIASELLIASESCRFIFIPPPF